MPQLSFLPFASPDNVTNTLEHLLARVSRLQPDLDPNQCLALLGELALLAMRCDAIEGACERRAKAAATRFSLI